MKKLPLLFAVGVLVVSTMFFSGCSKQDGQNGEENREPDPAAIVTFPDPNLEQLIRKRLRLGNDVITAADMAKLEHLDSYHDDYTQEYGITDLTGLEYAVNLVSLTLDRQKISDFTILAGFPNLRSLSLRRTGISDLAPLGQLAELAYLDLSNNMVKDISPLQDLTNLETVVLSHNQVSDITPLAGLINLKKLNLSSNQIVGISTLGDLINLRELDLSWNLIINLSPLAKLTGLKNLFLEGNRIHNISPLQHLNLNHLRLSYNTISDITPLADMDELFLLNLSDTLVDDIALLSSLPRLSYLTLSGNPLMKISQIEAFRDKEINVLAAGRTETDYAAPFNRDDWYAYVGEQRLDSATTVGEAEWKLGKVEMLETHYPPIALDNFCSYPSVDLSFINYQLWSIEIKKPDTHGPRGIKIGDTLDAVVGKFPGKPGSVEALSDHPEYSYHSILYEDGNSSGTVYYSETRHPIKVSYAEYIDGVVGPTIYSLNIFLNEGAVWSIELRIYYPFT